MKCSAVFCSVALWLFVSGLTIPSPTIAGGEEPFEPIDAQAMIDACWDETYEKRLGTTVDMREGISQSVLCLEDRVLDQLKVLWSSTVFPPERVAEELTNLRNTYGDLYWRLYNEHEGCTPCGTMYRTYDVTAEARLLEQVLRDAVERRNKYELR